MRNRPVLQNIPIRTELGKKLREAFRRENPILVEVDYSSLESAEVLDFIERLKNHESTR